MSNAIETPVYKKKDFMTDQLVRWCPGCGDYSILSQVQTAFTQMDIPKENFAVISGIGCSSRFPYYMETYGFHTIHGRAPAFASGLKVSRPELSVWLISGDGDSLSIGGNHFIHVLRRNVDINYLLFNNEIYGLTKGQYSPTSEVGKVTKSSPMGSIDNPFNPIRLALGAGGTFIARSADVMPKELRALIMDCEAHHGTSFLEIHQNCLIFNDNAFSKFNARKVRAEHVLMMQHGQPLVWGAETKRGLVMEGTSLKIVELGEDYSESDCVIHDETNLAQAQMLALLTFPEVVPYGIFYRVEGPVYEDTFHEQIATARETKGWGDLEALLHTSDVWNVK